MEATDHAHCPGLAGDPATAPIGGGEGGEGVVVEHRVVGGRLGTLLQDVSWVDMRRGKLMCKKPRY